MFWSHTEIARMWHQLVKGVSDRHSRQCLWLRHGEYNVSSESDGRIVSDAWKEWNTETNWRCRFQYEPSSVFNASVSCLLRLFLIKIMLIESPKSSKALTSNLHLCASLICNFPMRIQYRNGFQWKITHMLCFSPYFLAECMMHHRGRNSTWLIFVIVQIYERLRLVSSRRAFLLHIYTKQVSFTVHSIKGLK